MSRGIAVHVVAGLLFVGVGTPDAQESIPRPAVKVLPTSDDSSSPTNDILEPGVLFRLDCAAGIDVDAGGMVAIAPSIHLDDPTDDIDGRQHSDRSLRDASESPQAKAGSARRWFSRAMLWMVEFVVGGLLQAGGR